MKKKRESIRKYPPPILVRLEDEQFPKIEAIAEAEHISRAAAIRMGVDRLIETYQFEEEKK